MGLCLVTPTRDRPESFAMTERWIAGQTLCHDRWIVVNDGSRPYHYTLGQTVLRRPYSPPGYASHAANVLTALAALPEDCDRVAIVEDDDFYAPEYLATVATLLDCHPLVGLVPARYYNVRHRRFLEIHPPGHASLGQTAFRRPLESPLAALCVQGGRLLDLRLWTLLGPSWGHRASRPGLHVSVKGMPGADGLGHGHGRRMGKPDRDGWVFRRWGLPEVYSGFASSERSRSR